MAEQETDHRTADCDSAEKRMVPSIERSSPPGDNKTLNVKDNSNPEEGSHGDYKREMPRNEQEPMIAESSREYNPEEKKTPETTGLSDVPLSTDMAEQETDHRTADCHSAEKRMVPSIESSSPPGDNKTLNVKDNSNPEEGSHGDYKREMPRNEQKPMIAESSREYNPEEKKTPETTGPPTLVGKKDDQVDGPDEETPDSNDTNTEEDCHSAEKRMVPSIEKSSPPGDNKTLNVKDNSNPEEGSHGDYKREMPRNEQKPMIAESSREYNPEEKKTPETTGLSDVPLSTDMAEQETDHRTADCHSAEKRMVPSIERSSPPGDNKTLNVKDNSNTEEGSHGDYKREMPRNEQEPMIAESSREYNPEEKKTPETTGPPTLVGKKDDQVDGPDEETPDSNDAKTEEDDESCLEKEEEDMNTIPTQTKEDVETIGPTIKETADAEPAIPVVIGKLWGNLGKTFLICSLVIAVIAVMWHFFQPKSSNQKDEVRQIDIFIRQLEKVKTQFPNQRPELWDRSKIHLLRHLQTAQPTEPVSLILTAGHRGEKTLHCLAQRLAFASSLNASVLHIDGASKASQDSDQVKLDIDRKLQGAFEGDKPVAVINRFEELPPGSTLIFYRYCDHSADKKTCLIFTVLLGEEEEIPAETRLSTVEELVDDHLQKKFLSDGHPVSFDRMDIDKYSGLWSRISHLILPVAAEERIEREGC